MARVAGTIRIAVDAETGKLIGQLKVGGKKGGAAAAKEIDKQLGDVEGKELLARLAVISKAAQREFAAISVDFDVNQADLRSDLAGVQAQLRNADIELALHPRLDQSELQGELQEARLLIGSLTADVKVELDSNSVLDAVQKAQALLETVGDMDIGVNFEFQEATARLERFVFEENAKQREIEVAAQVEFQKATDSINRFVLQENAKQREIEVAIQVELQKATDRINRFVLQENARQREVDVAIELDLRRASARLQRFVFQENARNRTIEVAAELELGKATLRLQQFAATQSKVSLEVELETALAKLEASALRTKIEANDIDIGIDFDLETATLRELQLIRANQEANDIEIPVKMDTSAFDRDARGLSLRAKAIGVGIATLMEPAFVAVEGLAAAFTAVLGSAINATISAVGALTPIVAGFGAVLSASVVGMQGFGDAMSAIGDEMDDATEEGRAFNSQAEGIQKALGGLAPEAAAAASALADMKPALRGLRLNVQNRLFEDMDGILAVLGEDTLPNVEEALGLAADSTNKFVKELALVASQTDFADLFTEVQPAVDDILAAVVALVRTFEPFLRAAAPAASSLASSLRDGAESLERWVKANPEKIGEFLERGLESLREWGRLLQATGKLLGTIFEAGQDSGDGFVVSLTNIIGKWDDWLNTVQGQTALAEFFATGETAIAALRPVLDGLREAFDVLVTPDSVERFQRLGEAVGELLPALAELFATIGRANLISIFAETLTAVIVAMGPLLEEIGLLAEAFADLPTGVLAAVGAFIALVVVAVKVGKAITAVRAALIAFGTAAGPVGLAITAIAVAIGALVVIYDALEGSNREVAARADEVAGAMARSTAAILDEADAANTATIAMDSLSAALTSSGSDGAKLTKALGTLGLTTEDAAQALLDMADDPLTSLKRLGEEFGLTSTEADALARIVNGTDDEMQVLARSMDLGAESSRFSAEEIGALGAAMEELQDQTEKTDMDQLARDFLSTDAASSKLNQSILAQAEAQTGLKRTGEDLLPLQAAYTELLNESAVATAEEKEAIEAQNVALEESQAAFEQSAEAAGLSASATRKAAAEAAKLATPFGQAAAKISEAADAADDFNNALDVLVSPFLDVQAAADATAENFDALAERISGGQEGLDGYSLSLDIATEAGRANREQIRESITGITDFADAMLRSGASTEEVTAVMGLMREQLVNQLVDFGLSKEAADEWVTSLGLAPDTVEVAIEQIGMDEALDKTAALDAGTRGLPDGAAIEIDGESIKVAGADVEVLSAGVRGLPDGAAISIDADSIPSVKEQTAELDAGVRGLPDGAAIEVELPGGEDSRDTTQGLDDDLTSLPDVTSPLITMPGLTEAIGNVQLLDAALAGLPARQSVSISIPGITTRTAEVNALRNAIARLSNKTVTITTNRVSSGLPGNMTGSIINSPTVTRVGELGYAEAIVPLQLPLNRVDPSVRDMAALLRGGGGAPAASGKAGVTNNFVINEVNDSEATASRVVNRIASLV